MFSNYRDLDVALTVSDAVKFCSPLEQFEIFHVSFFGHCFYDLNILVLSAIVVVLVVFFCLYIGVVGARPYTTDGYQSITVNIYRFIVQLVIQQASRQALVLLPMMLWLFMFISLANLSSLIPFAFTVNAHISVTLSLALGLNLGFLFWGFDIHGINFLRLFVPSGVPRLLVPVIVVIEVISYSIRSFSLALRLFANLMAGHTLIHILIGFLVVAVSSDIFLGAILYPAIVAVGLLEFGISILQAYVFVTLTCIYYSDALTGGH